MSVILTNELLMRYGSFTAVNQVSLHVERGELFGFLGPNGAGKSTTIRILTGFLKPNSGSAQILERDCWDESTTIKQDIGYLAGDVRLYSWMTATNALEFVSRVRRRDVSVHGLQIAERFRLDPHLPVRKMSRGTRQKLGLLLAIAHQPKLVILDEPTSGLDPIIQRELMQILRELANNGSTVFFSSHTLSEVESLCDRIAIIRDGRIVEDATIQSLRERSARRIEVFFNDSDAADADPPAFLDVVAKSLQSWSCVLSGTTTEFIRWAAQQPLTDVTISPPDLERLFHQYYD